MCSCRSGRFTRCSTRGSRFRIRSRRRSLALRPRRSLMVQERVACCNLISIRSYRSRIMNLNVSCVVPCWASASWVKMGQIRSHMMGGSSNAGTSSRPTSSNEPPPPPPPPPPPRNLDSTCTIVAVASGTQTWKFYLLSRGLRRRRLSASWQIPRSRRLSPRLGKQKASRPFFAKGACALENN